MLTPPQNAFYLLDEMWCFFFFFPLPLSPCMFLSPSIAYTASVYLTRRTTILYWNICFSSFDDLLKKKNCWKKFLIYSSPIIFYFEVSIFLSYLLAIQIISWIYKNSIIHLMVSHLVPTGATCKVSHHSNTFRLERK